MATEVRSTYRVQLHGGFTFDDVAAIAPYLKTLGVSHVYLSPFLQARKGSTHGYDVVDHSKLNEELGGSAGYERMTAALTANGLGQILDIVPNHIAIGTPENRWWWDVLKHGRSSAYARHFDIDWNAPQDDLHGKVLAPVLGNDLPEVLRRGEITIGDHEGEPAVRYFDHVYPLAPGTEQETDLPSLLGRQHFLLANWRRAVRELNYRRFFDINELAGLEMHLPPVFRDTHELILELIRDGHLDGLRVDHIDGLRDPSSYLEWLRAEVGPGGYLVVEKILEPGEKLPSAWPVEGTTGYDFMNLVGGLLIDPATEDRFTALYRDFAAMRTPLEGLTHEKKLLIMRSVMPSDIGRLTRELLRIPSVGAGAEPSQQHADEVRVALGETIAALPVYRTYVSPRGERSEGDVEILELALATARRRAPHVPEEIFEQLERVLLGEDRSKAALAFVLRFQQATGPIMAKGIEDTLFYNYNRFTSLNEVGGVP